MSWKVVVLRTLLPLPIVVLLLGGAGCTKPSYGDGKAIVDDAGPRQDGPREDPDAGPAPLGAPPDPAKAPRADGGTDAGEPAVVLKPDAATQGACIVGVSRIGECKLP